MRVLSAHTGPPFPIVSNKIEGAYTVSVWTDPDSTDDGIGGRPVLGDRSARRREVASAVGDARQRVARASGPAREKLAPGQRQPIADDPAHRYVALVMDHEGRFRVRVAIEGPLGTAATEADVDATYDLRPAPYLIVVYLLPFLLIGFLWIKLMLRRRRAAKS